MKQNLTFIIVVVGLFITFVISLIIFVTAEKEVPNMAAYYQNLVSRCEVAENPGCCLESIRIMKAGNYVLFENECSKGFEQNMLKCISSLKWCEPELR